MAERRRRTEGRASPAHHNTAQRSAAQHSSYSTAQHTAAHSALERPEAEALRDRGWAGLAVAGWLVGWLAGWVGGVGPAIEVVQRARPPAQP